MSRQTPPRRASGERPTAQSISPSPEPTGTGTATTTARTDAPGLSAVRVRRVFDPAKHCGAPTNAKFNGARPCLQWKGHGTDHVGAGKCKLHFGNAAGERIQAANEERDRATAAAAQKARELLAKNALAIIPMETSLDPLESLMEAMRVAAWIERALRQMLLGRGALYGVDHLGDARPDVVAQMHGKALKQRADISKLCIDAGLDKRMVEIAERQADLLGEALDAALRAAGVTDPRALEAADVAIVRVLEGRVAAGVELN